MAGTAGRSYHIQPALFTFEIFKGLWKDIEQEDHLCRFCIQTHILYTFLCKGSKKPTEQTPFSPSQGPLLFFSAVAFSYDQTASGPKPYTVPLGREGSGLISTVWVSCCADCSKPSRWVPSYVENDVLKPACFPET